MTAETQPGRLVGMVHLSPLPGSPRFEGSMQAVIEDAVGRAETLTDAGFGSLMIENFGDTPFFADAVPPVTIAAMTRAVSEVKRAVPVPVGVNVLRNDALAAISIGAATNAHMIRVNVLSGSMNTDQGPIVGKAAEVARLRHAVGPDIAIWADVFVKHAAPPPGLTLTQATADLWERAGADALVVSGSGTGHAPDLDRFRTVRDAAPGAPLVLGSGANPDNLAAFAEVCDHIIVGTTLEVDAIPGASLDPRRVDTFMTAASRSGIL